MCRKVKWCLLKRTSFPLGYPSKCSILQRLLQRFLKTHPFFDFSHFFKAFTFLLEFRIHQADIPKLTSTPVTGHERCKVPWSIRLTTHSILSDRWREGVCRSSFHSVAFPNGKGDFRSPKQREISRFQPAQAKLSWKKDGRESKVIASWVALENWRCLRTQTKMLQETGIILK